MSKIRYTLTGEYEIDPDAYVHEFDEDGQPIRPSLEEIREQDYARFEGDPVELFEIMEAAGFKIELKVIK